MHKHNTLSTVKTFNIWRIQRAPFLSGRNGVHHTFFLDFGMNS